MFPWLALAPIANTPHLIAGSSALVTIGQIYHFLERLYCSLFSWALYPRRSGDIQGELGHENKLIHLFLFKDPERHSDEVIDTGKPMGKRLLRISICNRFKKMTTGYSLAETYKIGWMNTAAI